ncbi:M50 family metallopeptidase [Paenibacillus sp. Leaf72]|uniref:M50 family metallopeptidase n=1 Tax=Paenibacillus sp. Leaf72 TaxID=1736234 RepID=UPI0006FDE46E|nr:site-2 protease family protein [Paenibacillus sp. Leaf72]KQN96886.1 hypothetical protein ASF12_22725 [Paenibacillus sp. Leaf72]
MLSILAVILLFTTMVAIHEGGHLIMAKRAGVFCYEFSIGMGPKVISFTIGETLYSLRLFPIGGYVKMAGVEEKLRLEGRVVSIRFQNQKIIELYEKNTSDASSSFLVESIDHSQALIHLKKVSDQTKCAVHYGEDACIIANDGQRIPILPYQRMYQSKKPHKRIAILLAGPLANIILAVFITLGITAYSGVPNNEPIIGSLLTENNHALESSDKILSLNGQAVESWNDLIKKWSDSPTTPVMEILRDDENKKVLVSADLYRFVQPEVTHNPLRIIAVSLERTYHQSTILVNGLKQLFIGELSLHNVSGPAGVMKLSYDVASQSDIITFFMWVSIMNLNVAIFNLLPLPALDGGRIFLILVEWLRGRPIASKKEIWVHFIGFVFMITLTILATWNDIIKFISS